MRGKKNIDELIWGIDYGKKLSGNTVICEKQREQLVFFKAPKNEDADQFILQAVEDRKPELIFIDAPLSLPGVYADKKNYDDYFYRNCDKQLGAMSPMFLGGLTARAIRLKHTIEKMGVEIKETYPKTLAKQFKLKNYGYRLGKENIEKCSDILDKTSLIEVDKKQILSWHHFDALLALLSALRYYRGFHYTHGNEKEGLIYT
ncbi:MAG: hypothetical protein ACQESJ_03235 [Bacteroidota bacterium]